MTDPTLLQLTLHPTDKVNVKFTVIIWPISIHLSQSDSAEIEMEDINKAVSGSLKDIIIDAINKIRKIKKDLITNQVFPFLLLFQQQTMNKNLLTAHWTTWFGITWLQIAQTLNVIRFFVNSEIKLTSGMQRVQSWNWKWIQPQLWKIIKYWNRKRSPSPALIV